MTARVFCLLLGPALLIANACEGASSPTLGNKNTNWLSTCSASAECGEASSCTCGVCTIACDSSAACADSSGACTQDLATTLQCGGTAQSPICLKPCSRAEDCDDTQTCVQGTCIARPKDLCSQHDSALICSDLDAAVPTDWVEGSSAGDEVSASTSLRFAGAAALRAHTSGMGGRSRIIHELPMMTTGSLYLRAWVYMNPGAATEDVHALVVGDVNTADYGTKFLYSAGKLRVATSVAPVPGSIDPPFGRWYCLRLELGIGAMGSVKAYVDDQVLADQTGVDTLPATGVHNVSAGIDFAGQTQPGELYVDDLAIDTQPLDCWR
jgi:hypothetical protein